jgi:hypothetical protein
MAPPSTNAGLQKTLKTSFKKPKNRFCLVRKSQDILESRFLIPSV